MLSRTLRPMHRWQHAKPAPRHRVADRGAWLAIRRSNARRPSLLKTLGLEGSPLAAPIGSSSRFLLAAISLTGALLQHDGRPLHAQGMAPQLCLHQVSESSLPAFEPMGLSVFDDAVSGPSITMWSRTELLVMQLSSGAEAKHIARAPLPSRDPLAVAVVRLDVGGAIADIFDARSGTIWTMNLASGRVIDSHLSASASLASGAAYSTSGWVRAHRSLDPTTRTSSVILAIPPAKELPVRIPARVGEATPPSGLDRSLHVRPDNRGGFLVQDARFPFLTTRFTRDGIEAWRGVPQPQDLRDRLEEADLRYVIATPALALDGAILNTFVALRSGRRVSALRFSTDHDIRYRTLPSEMAFLGVLPKSRQLIATRSDRPYRMVVFDWRWVDQRQRCT